MNLLIKNVIINDPGSAWNEMLTDVRIRDGKYNELGSDLSPVEDEKMFDAKGAFLSPGWMDLRVSFGEPGLEQKETIRSGQDAAAHGGFTAVLMMPSTQPPVEHGSAVSFIRDKSQGHLVEVLPAGVLTVGRSGKELAGMLDMKAAGAIAFTDDKRAIADTGLLLRAQLYASDIDARLISYADDQTLTRGLQVNESAFTMELGFKGMPAFAEAIAIERDLSLVRYTGRSLHLSGISTAEAIRCIRKAKQEGLPISAEVYIYHLLLDDSSLENFDSNLKVKPPLRTAEDVMALREAVLDGTIDVICSDHSPHEKEAKQVEFDYSAFGMITLEVFFGLLTRSFGKTLSPALVYNVLVNSPRRILGLPVPVINAGNKANFTCYHPDYEWQFTNDRIYSKSDNTPFKDQKFNGMVLLTGNKGRFASNLG
jgi:dihydroorotase